MTIPGGWVKGFEHAEVEVNFLKTNLEQKIGILELSGCQDEKSEFVWRNAV